MEWTLVLQTLQAFHSLITKPEPIGNNIKKIQCKPNGIRRDEIATYRNGSNKKITIKSSMNQYFPLPTAASCLKGCASITAASDMNALSVTSSSIKEGDGKGTQKNGKLINRCFFSLKNNAAGRSGFKVKIAEIIPQESEKINV